MLCMGNFEKTDGLIFVAGLCLGSAWNNYILGGTLSVVLLLAVGIVNVYFYCTLD